MMKLGYLAGCIVAAIPLLGGPASMRLPEAILPMEAIDDVAYRTVPAVFAGTSLELDGEIAGQTWLGKSDSAQLSLTAKITGDLWLAPKSAAHKAGDKPTVEELQGKLAKEQPLPELAAKITGKQDSLPGTPKFPRLSPRVDPLKGSDVVIGDGSNFSTWATARNITINKKDSVTIPPGRYGTVAIDRGILILTGGTSATPARYDFRAVTIKQQGQLQISGPVTLILNADTSISGDVGSALHPEWLDLRLIGASLSIENNTHVYGAILAPSATVTLGVNAEVTGAVAAGGVKLGNKAKVTTPKSFDTTVDRQPFLAKALRVESRIEALGRRIKYDYYLGVGYPDDVPHIQLTEGRRAGFPKTDLQNDRLALFGALSDALVGSGFDRAVVTLTRYRASGSTAADVTNYAFTRTDFEQLLAQIGGKLTPAENVRAIGESPLLLNFFSIQCARQGVPNR